MYLTECPFSVFCCEILPLETLRPGDPSGGEVYLRIFMSPEEASRLVSNSQRGFLHREELLPPRPTPKLEDHPSLAVRGCLFNLFTATLHIGGRSSNRNLRTRHAVVTGTYIHVRTLLLLAIVGPEATMLQLTL
jgi:hypothetical protein